MNMFKGFYAEPLDYIPDNMHKKPPLPKTAQIVSDSLDVIYDKYGRMKGYSWNYGETVTIPISVDLPIRIEADAYFSTIPHEEPKLTTAGHLGQKFYNLIDAVSWKLTSYVPDNKSFIWTKEPRLTFPENGARLVYLTPDMTDRYILVEFINFRGEQMFERIEEGKNHYDWSLNIDESLALLRGIYEMNIYVGDVKNQYKKLTKRYEIVIR